MKKKRKNENRFDAFAWLVVTHQHVLYNFFFSPIIRKYNNECLDRTPGTVGFQKIGQRNSNPHGFFK